MAPAKAAMTTVSLAAVAVAAATTDVAERGAAVTREAGKGQCMRKLHRGRLRLQALHRRRSLHRSQHGCAESQSVGLLAEQPCSRRSSSSGSMLMQLLMLSFADSNNGRSSSHRNCKLLAGNFILAHYASCAAGNETVLNSANSSSSSSAAQLLMHTEACIRCNSGQHAALGADSSGCEAGYGFGMGAHG